MAYWIEVFTEETWQAFREAGGSVAGFPASKRAAASRIEAGDTLLAYLAGKKTWIAVIEVTGRPFFSDEPAIWGPGRFPVRVPVRTVTDLTDHGGVPIEPMLSRLTTFEGLRKSHHRGWGAYFMSPPTRWPDSDGLVVVDAVTISAADHRAPGAGSATDLPNQTGDRTGQP